VAHDATGVATMELTTKGLGGLVGGIKDASQVRDLDDLALAPFLDGKILHINVARARGGTVVINHIDSGKVVNMKKSGARGEVAKVMQNGPEVLGHLSGLHRSNKLGFGGGGGADRLKFGFISHSATSKEESKASNRAAGAEISGVGSVDKAHKRSKRVTGEGAKGVIMMNQIKGNNRKGRKGLRAPVENTPIVCATKVETNVFQSVIVFLMGSCTETAQQGDSITDVRTT
jgi:hypothetical protein